MHGTEHSIPVMPLIYAFINFGIFVSLLVYFLKKPVTSFLVERKKRTLAFIDESSAAFETSEKNFKQVTFRMDNIKADADAFLNRIIEDSNDAGKKLISEAKKAAGSIQDDARMLVEAEYRQAYKKLKFSVIDRIMLKAGKEITDTLEDGQKNRYLDEYYDISREQGNR
ncbi:MAG: ATP synthase F0 subunit B [Oligoflexia bacterium]|nr:ATP synthase F0 subunit B [Oligoflexia bacterium]